MIKGLLVTALAVSSINAATNKTFLMPRSQGVNLAMEYATYNELINHKNGDFFGAHFQVTPFYMESSDKNDIGRYFGIKDKNLIAIDHVTANANTDFSYLSMFHDVVPNVTTKASIKFEPELQAYGARIDYYQDLEKILDGLYLKVALPIVHVENDMHINVSDKVGFFTAADAGVNAVEDYFLGTYGAGSPANTARALANNQAILEYAKIGGSHSETSVADIDVVLGYKIFDKDKYVVALNLGLTIPVGNDSDGVWVFEPVVGNGDHWGFGGGLEAWVKLWEDGDQNIKLTAVANYRYLFEGTETRTLGLKKGDGTKLDWGQYRYAADVTVNKNVQDLIPTANILTKNVNVEPGSQFDAIAYLTYNNGGWTMDLGYNFFWKEREDVNLKDTTLDSTNYYLAHNLLDSTNASLPGVPGGNDDGGLVTEASIATTTPLDGALATGYQIKAVHIDTSAAETPSMDTHKIFGSVGYIFKDWEYPVMLGLGGGYEFADQQGIENWQIWGKFGIKF
ncbi:MAG: hypothetical protein JXR36_16075 [Bacteroidales bacterium]|nr:hypothetical protein [Bacteroidales bacterium]